MPYVGAANIVAALFILGTASRRNYSPSAIVSARGQVRSVMSFWSLAFLSLAFFLFLAKSGPDFSRGTITSFGLLGLVLLLGFHLWISTTLKNALARGTIAGDRAITIGDRGAVMALSPQAFCRRPALREIRRYLLPPSNGLRLCGRPSHNRRSNRIRALQQRGLRPARIAMER